MPSCKLVLSIKWHCIDSYRSGLQVITTCSPRNFQLVKDLGADAVFDYHDPDCGTKIRELTNDNLKHAQDCITDPKVSMPICAAALSSNGDGAKYSALLNLEDTWPRTDVVGVSTSAYTAFGKDLDVYGAQDPANPEHRDFAKKFWSLTQTLLETGKLKLLPTVREGGLQGIAEGLEDLETGRISGQKLVYRV